MFRSLDLMYSLVQTRRGCKRDREKKRADAGERKKATAERWFAGEIEPHASGVCARRRNSQGKFGEAQIQPAMNLEMSPSKPLPITTGMTSHFQRRIPTNAMALSATANQSTPAFAGKRT